MPSMFLPRLYDLTSSGVEPVETTERIDDMPRETFVPSEWDLTCSYLLLTNKKLRKINGICSIKALPSVSRLWMFNPMFLHEHGITNFIELEDWVNENGTPIASEYLYQFEEHFRFRNGINRWELRHRDEINLEQYPCSIGPYAGTTPSSNFVLVEQTQPENISRKLVHRVNFGLDSVTPHGVRFLYIYEEQTSARQDGSFYTQVNNYTFSPPFSPMYTPRTLNSDMLFGLELEISSNITAAEFNYIVTQVEPRQEPFFYFKSDSSIRGTKRYKMELVTHPCTPAFLRVNFRILFEKLEKLCKGKGQPLSDFVDVHIEPANGLHIHVNQRAFCSETNINKFVAIWNLWDSSSQELLQLLSSRVDTIRDHQFCHVHPALAYKTTSYLVGKGLSKPGPYDVSDRHSACHISRQTVEVRIFQGIFDLQHILNCIQIVEAVHAFAAEAPYSAIKATFSKYFKNWLNSRSGFVRVKRIVNGKKK